MTQKMAPVPPPRFDLPPSELVHRAKDLIATSTQVWDGIAQVSPDDATFTNVIVPLLQDENALSASSYLGWLNACSPFKELRDASTEVDKLVREAKVGRFARQDIFRLVQAVVDRNEPLADEEDRLALVKLREQFRANGLGLSNEAATARITEIARLTKEIGQAYVRNLDGKTDGLWLSMDALEGVPASYLKRWKASEDDGQDRRWVDFKTPSLMAVLRNAKREEVRRQYWTAWENRFRDDNGPLQKDMVCLRDEAARLMGYPHHAKRKEADRMIDTETAMRFLAQMQEVLKPPAQARLQAFAKIKTCLAVGKEEEYQVAKTPIFKWDEWYVSQLYDKEKFRVDQEKLSEYFPLERALPAIMGLLEDLFGLRFVRLDTDPSSGTTAWHPDVRAFSVWDEDNLGRDDKFLGFLYLDLFPRNFKYGHKGHYCLQPGYARPDGSRQHPAAVIMANYSPPCDSLPSLLKYDELLSCFHELGHAVHNLSSRTKYARHHGAAVPRDFVEVPSIFLEHLFLQREVVRSVSSYYLSPEYGGDGSETQQIPDDLLDGLMSSKSEIDALAKLSVLFQSTYDLTIHSPSEHKSIEAMDLAETFNRLRADIGLVPGPEELGSGLGSVHGHTRFRAIMGAYDSVYYTYLLAGAISYDIWEAKFRSLPIFDSAGSGRSVVSRSMKEEFRRWRRLVLEPGGGTPSHWDLIRRFLGREPNVASYMNYIQRT